MHKSVVAVNNAPSIHKCDSCTHLQPKAKRHRTVSCAAAKWVHEILTMRRAKQNGKNCSTILCFECEETIQNFLARSTSSPQNAAALQQRNQSVHNDPEKNIEWNDTATGSSQLCRENSSTRNRRTTKLISQTFKAKHQQKKKNQKALTNRATFGWAVKSMGPLNPWVPNH